MESVYPKENSKKSIKTTISLPPALAEAAEQIIVKYAFSGFSDYIQSRIRKDAGLDISS